LHVLELLFGSKGVELGDSSASSGSVDWVGR
jgi:hypothetical protein